MRSLLRWVVLVAGAALSLQLFFVARIALMAVVDPQSTAFQRSEAWRLLRTTGGLRWSQQWVDTSHISDQLKRAVIASEDDAYTSHDGVDWEALHKARIKNSRVEEQAARRAAGTQAANKAGAQPLKVVGGSTITQHLAKNLLLSGERNLFRKSQELVLTMLLETLLSKQRILEIYLNSVEWGEGVFGAQAAAQHYYRKGAARLTTSEAARLAVMLPRPKYFEKLPNSGYLSSRAGTIALRMAEARLP